MNKLSTVLLAVLFIAVGILYFLHFKSSCKQPSSSKASVAVNKNITGSNLRLAYIDLDSIKEHYAYFKLKNQEIEREKMRIENDIEGGVNKLESDRANFMKRGQSITQEEAEKFQMEYQNRYQALGQRRETLLNQHLSNQAKALDDIQKKINDYLQEYNKTANFQFIFSTGEGNLTLYYKDSALNITNEVIEGLNERYQKEKNK
ncbi:MAG: OmpH family outer membrane protein [Bacteroidota bacterium]